MKAALRWMCILAYVLALTGCATSGTSLFTPERETSSAADSTGSKRKVQADSFFGPDPMIERNRLEIINLLEMLDPDRRAKQVVEIRSGGRDWGKLSIDEKYEAGFTAFYLYPADTLVQRRNRLQDRLLIAADQRCGIYKKLLFQNQADSNFYFGTASTVAGALGALFGERGAKNLAATAGIFSGLRAEYGQSYFQNLTAQVIVKGVEERLKSILARIRDAQRQGSIELYTVQSAVKDAVFYDSQCSIVAGLEEAQDAIRLVADPGLDTVNRIIAKSKITQGLANDRDGNNTEALMNAARQLEGTPLTHRFTNIGIGQSPAAGLLSLGSTDALAPGRFDQLLIDLKQRTASVETEGKKVAKDFVPSAGKDVKLPHKALEEQVEKAQSELLTIRRAALLAQSQIAAAADETKALNARKSLTGEVLKAQKLINDVAVDERALSLGEAKFRSALDGLKKTPPKKEEAKAAVEKAYKDSFGL